MGLEGPPKTDIADPTAQRIWPTAAMCGQRNEHYQLALSRPSPAVSPSARV